MINEDALFGRTEVKISPCPEKLSRHQTSLWMGSCFAGSFQPNLTTFGYPSLVNPLGVVYHPLVLGELLFLPLDELLRYNFENGGVWLNYWLSSHFSAASESELTMQISAARNEARAFFDSVDWFVMTWGTAFWYEHEILGRVGKCHKQPSKLFRKQISQPAELAEKWKIWILEWRKQNSKGKVLLTISPVRHTRDGLADNSLSKSILRVAAESLCKTLPGVYYFPSYELVLDELRDYRYFESDLIHPGPGAVDWIWRKFSAAFLERDEALVNEKILELERLKQHRPRNEFGNAYEIWKKGVGEKSEEVRKMLEFEREKRKNNMGLTGR
jgi:hypothetical protein